MSSRRPKVIANFALTCDGKVSTKNFSPTGFTSAADKIRLREIRSLGDALLAGASTVAADSMSMGLGDKHLQELRIARGQEPEPLRVIASNSGHINSGWKVFKNRRTPLVLFTTQAGKKNLPPRLPQFCEIRVMDAQQLSLAGVLEILKSEYGTATLVCEGGPRILRALAEIPALDELYITYARTIFGGAKSPTLTGLNKFFLNSPLALRLATVQEREGEVFACFQSYAARKKINPLCVMD